MSQTEQQESFEAIIQKSHLVDFCNTITAEVSSMDGPLVSECRFHISEDNIRVCFVDPANVAMVNPGVLDKQAFESYNASNELTIGISVVRLLEMINPASNDSLIELVFDPRTRRLLIRYDNANVQMGLIDPENIRQEPDKPDLELPNRVLLEGHQLQEALSIADIISDHVSVSVDVEEESVTFGTEGDVDEGSVTYGASDVIEHEYVESTESLFSLGYLQVLSKPIPSDAEVTLFVGQEFPVQLSWSSMDGNFSVEQMLAPRIKSD